jgi:hypothetical protein
MHFSLHELESAVGGWLERIGQGTASEAAYLMKEFFAHLKSAVQPVEVIAVDALHKAAAEAETDVSAIVATAKAATADKINAAERLVFGAPIAAIAAPSPSPHTTAPNPGSAPPVPTVDPEALAPWHEDATTGNENALEPMAGNEGGPGDDR